MLSSPSSLTPYLKGSNYNYRTTVNTKFTDYTTNVSPCHRHILSQMCMCINFYMLLWPLHTNTTNLMLSIRYITTFLRRCLTGSHCTVVYSTLPRKNFFNDCLKQLCNKSGCLTSAGRLFQTQGPAALKAQSRNLALVRLMRSIRVLAERSLLGHVSVTRQQSSAR